MHAALWQVMWRRLGRWRMAPAAGALAALALLAPWDPGRVRAAASAGAYVGDAVCRSCHAEVAQGWSGSAHGRALSDPGLPEGRQGCEACHGPGSAHVGSAGKQPMQKLTDLSPSDITALCGRCHATGGAAPAADGDAWKLSPHAQQKGSCLTCHTLHGQERGSLRAPSAKLCLTCHAKLVDAASPESTHAPVAQGQCTLCHEPHGGQPPYSLRPDLSAQCEKCHSPAAAPMAAAHKGYAVAGSDCTRCHASHSFDREHGYLRQVVHTPFAQGNCQVCHDKAPSVRLRQDASQLCATCHPEQTILPAADAAGRPMKAHPPVANGMCLTCHEPHASDTHAGLRASPAALCATCHRTIGAQAAAASHKHPPVAKGDCLSCHQGHASAERGLLRTAQSELCQGCHKDQATHAHPMGPKAKDPNTGQPLTCTSCHAVHGSEYRYILPQEETKLCLTCHRLEQ